MDDAEGSLGFANGNVVTGAIFSYSLTGGFPFWNRDSLAISVGYIYDLDASLGSVSLGLGMGFAF
jgi:hypothetical protein